MFNFFKKREEKKLTDKWRDEMLLRWIDLEARVSVLENTDKIIKKTRKKIGNPEEEKPEDSNTPTYLIPV